MELLCAQEIEMVIGGLADSGASLSVGAIPGTGRLPGDTAVPVGVTEPFCPPATGDELA